MGLFDETYGVSGKDTLWVFDVHVHSNRRMYFTVGRTNTVVAFIYDDLYD